MPRSAILSGTMCCDILELGCVRERAQTSLPSFTALPKRARVESRCGAVV
jgi:hypothetical protein